MADGVLLKADAADMVEYTHEERQVRITINKTADDVLEYTVRLPRTLEDVPTWQEFAASLEGSYTVQAV